MTGRVSNEETTTGFGFKVRRRGSPGGTRGPGSAAINQRDPARRWLTITIISVASSVPKKVRENGCGSANLRPVA